MTSIQLKSTNKIYNNTSVSEEDSGFDLYCEKDQIIPGNSFSNKIKLGVHIALIKNGKRLAYKLYPRSSTGSKTPLRLSNSVGICDSGYNGELCAMVDNSSNEDFKVQKDSRLFQIVQFSGEPFESVSVVDELPTSKRGVGGFGSTGV